MILEVLRNFLVFAFGLTFLGAAIGAGAALIFFAASQFVGDHNKGRQYDRYKRASVESSLVCAFVCILLWAISSNLYDFAAKYLTSF